MKKQTYFDHFEANDLQVTYGHWWSVRIEQETEGTWGVKWKHVDKFYNYYFKNKIESMYKEIWDQYMVLNQTSSSASSVTVTSRDRSVVVVMAARLCDQGITMSRR